MEKDIFCKIIDGEIPCHKCTKSWMSLKGLAK